MLEWVLKQVGYDLIRFVIVINQPMRKLVEKIQPLSIGSWGYQAAFESADSVNSKFRWINRFFYW